VIRKKEARYVKTAIALEFFFHLYKVIQKEKGDLQEGINDVKL